MAVRAEARSLEPKHLNDLPLPAYVHQQEAGLEVAEVALQYGMPASQVLVQSSALDISPRIHDQPTMDQKHSGKNITPISYMHRCPLPSPFVVPS